MFKMNYVNAQLNIFYDPVEDVVKYGDEIEAKLKPYFGSGLQKLPVKGFVPIEVPVFMGISKEQNCLVSISGTRINVNSNATQIFDFDAFKKLCQDAYSIVDVLERKDKVLYCGVTLLGIVPQNEANIFLTEKFHKIESEKAIYDINTKITFVEDDCYYINITLGNVRENKDNSNGVSIEIDVNDRYRFNFNKQAEPYSGSDILEGLEEKISFIVNEKIETLIMEGKF